MDEMTLARLASIVKGMHDQGMSVGQIKENLIQMGIPEQDAKAVIAKAGLTPSTVDVHEQVSSVKEAVESGRVVEPVLEKLGEADEHFERLHQKVNILHEKHREMSERLSEIEGLRDEIDELRALLLEIRSLLEGVKELQRELLDVNKRVLARESIR